MPEPQYRTDALTAWAYITEIDDDLGFKVQDEIGAKHPDPAYPGAPRNAVGVRELAESRFRTTVGRSLLGIPAIGDRVV